MRTFENTDRQLIRDLMKRTVEGIAVSFGAEVDFRWFDYLPVVNNASVFADVAKEAAESIGYLAVEAKQSPGGEDFAYYQTLKPGFFVWMGTSGTEEWHHPAFTLNEEALLVAAKYFSNLSIKVLQQLATE